MLPAVCCMGVMLKPWLAALVALLAVGGAAAMATVALAGSKERPMNVWNYTCPMEAKSHHHPECEAAARFPTMADCQNYNKWTSMECSSIICEPRMWKDSKECHFHASVLGKGICVRK